MKKALVFGGSGQLGQCLKAVSVQRGVDGLVYPDPEFSDVLDVAGLTALFEKERPQYVINCAAYTAVDKAEDEVELARRVNLDGAANLAKLCRGFDSILIHISTDFVFGGTSCRPLTEEDATDPVNVYGLTKLEGEKAVQSILDKYFILRTSWLYSEFGNNFVKSMLRLGQERPELGIVSDQVGTPTYAIDLASCIIDIIGHDRTDYGVYHYSNEGVASWYDFAHEVFTLSKITTRVKPILSKDYVTKATRPSFSVLDKSRIKTVLQVDIPYWRDSLRRCIEHIKKETTTS